MNSYKVRKHQYLFVGWMERQLTERERGVLTAYMTGMSYAEIAQSLEITEKAVDNAMQRARRKLRKEFGRQP